MADYGLKIFDASGNVILVGADKITRLRYSNEVAAGASSNTTLSDIDGLSSVEISVKLKTGWDECSHLMSRSGTTITWTAQGATGRTYSPPPLDFWSPRYGSVNSLIFSFLYT